MRFLALLLTLLAIASCAGVPPPAPQGAGGLWMDAAIFTPVAKTIAGARWRVLVEMYEFGRPDLEAALVAVMAGIPERVGYARDGRGFLLSFHWRRCSGAVAARTGLPAAGDERAPAIPTPAL